MTGPDRPQRMESGDRPEVHPDGVGRPAEPTGAGTMADPARRVKMSRRHSLAKTLSWRVTATIDTFIISFFVTGSFAWAGSIAGLEVMTKMGLYYLHERAWARVRWGLH